jgi:hypothetical protein
VSVGFGWGLCVRKDGSQTVADPVRAFTPIGGR